jgi:hypothetical protein
MKMCASAAATLLAHQSLDAATAPPRPQGFQLFMDARAATASAGVAIDPLDVVREVTLGDGSPGSPGANARY